jgi:hypothetical protein
LDWWFKSYEVFKISAQVGACCQPLSMQQNLPKSTQNCKKLPKSTQRQLAWGTLKCHQNLRFEFFLKIKSSMCRGSTRVYVHRLDVQYNISLYVFFLSKSGLCMWISAYPLAENDFFLNVPHLSWVWDFGDMYLTHFKKGI